MRNAIWLSSDGLSIWSETKTHITVEVEYQIHVFSKEKLEIMPTGTFGYFVINANLATALKLYGYDYIGEL